MDVTSELLKARFLVTYPMHLQLSDCCHKWRRSVVKYEGQGQLGQTIKLFQLTPYVNDLLTLQSWFLTACRRLEKSFIVDGVKLVELSNNSFE